MTSIFDTISDIIQVRYEAQGYGVPVALDNGKWQPLSIPAEHHLLSVAWEETKEAGFGNGARGVYAIEGLGIIGIKVPIETGWNTAMTRATEIADAFQFVTVSNVEFMGAAIVHIGRQGNYYRYNVHIPFRVFDQQSSKQLGVQTGLNPKTAMDRINDRFNIVISGGLSLSTAFDNMEFDLPGVNETWCNWSVRHAEGQGEVGTRRFTIPGLAICGLRVPLETGTDTIYRLAGEIVSTFRGVNYKGVFFSSPSLARIGRSGPSHSQEWWQLNVRCPYWFEYVAA